MMPLRQIEDYEQTIVNSRCNLGRCCDEGDPAMFMDGDDPWLNTPFVGRCVEPVCFKA